MENTAVIQFPYGKFLEVTTVENFEKDFLLKYEQYSGFEGDYTDDVLKNFILITENYEETTQKMLSDEEIKELKAKRIKSIRFKKIPASQMSLEEIKGALQEKYSDFSFIDSTPQEPFIDQLILISDVNDNVIGKLKYAGLGVPGTFTELLSNAR